MAGSVGKSVASTRFNRQVVIGPYTCDFVARSIKLVIEVDGDSHGTTAQQDAARDLDLQQRGYRVLRFWNNDIMVNLEGVVRAIERAIGELPSPNPSREREGRNTPKSPRQEES